MGLAKVGRSFSIPGVRGLLHKFFKKALAKDHGANPTNGAMNQLTVIYP